MSYLTPQKALLPTIICLIAAAYYWSFLQKQMWHDAPPPAFVCKPSQYTTEIVSVDPLLIYINNFTTPQENTALVEAGRPNLASSEVYLNGIKRPSQERTSQSAGLPLSSPAVQCVLARAQAFLGPAPFTRTADFGIPQMVHYAQGQRFDLHHDWYGAPYPQAERDGSLRRWNRVASFFVFLEDGCEGGETWFPYLENVEAGEDGGKWRNHEDGGLAFRPRSGSALFWVNLHANGTGDERVTHAGLRLERGEKTAMNIWPRRYY